MKVANYVFYKSSHLIKILDGTEKCEQIVINIEGSSFDHTTKLFQIMLKFFSS
jgi:hypothetical protein